MLGLAAVAGPVLSAMRPAAAVPGPFAAALAPAPTGEAAGEARDVMAGSRTPDPEPLGEPLPEPAPPPPSSGELGLGEPATAAGPRAAGEPMGAGGLGPPAPGSALEGEATP
jgi:hypothetical protein